MTLGALEEVCGVQRATKLRFDGLGVIDDEDVVVVEEVEEGRGRGAGLRRFA